MEALNAVRGLALAVSLSAGTGAAPAEGPSVQIDRYTPSAQLEAPMKVDAPAGGDPLKSLVTNLPGYLGECVKAKGIAIPGLLEGAALVPRFDNGGVANGPSGANFSFKW